MTDRVAFEYQDVAVIEDWNISFDLKTFKTHRRKTYFLDEGSYSERIIYRNGFPQFVTSFYDPDFEIIEKFSINSLNKKPDFQKALKRIVKLYDPQLSLKAPFLILLKQLFSNPYKRPAHIQKIKVFPLEKVWTTLTVEQKKSVVY